MTPAQFADGYRRDGSCASELKLWASAFSLAIEDWRRANSDVRPAGMNNAAAATLGRCARMKAELAEWFSDGSEAPLSYRWYCGVLGLDAGAVRARLMAQQVGKLKRLTGRSPVSPSVPRVTSRLLGRAKQDNH